jgi:hypothetical protein
MKTPRPQDAWRDIPMDWATLMENVLDSSHVPFTHHKSISNRNILGDYDIKLTSDVTAAGFTGGWPPALPATEALPSCRGGAVLCARGRCCGGRRGWSLGLFVEAAPSPCAARVCRPLGRAC